MRDTFLKEFRSSIDFLRHFQATTIIVYIVARLWSSMDEINDSRERHSSEQQATTTSLFRETRKTCSYHAARFN